MQKRINKLEAQVGQSYEEMQPSPSPRMEPKKCEYSERNTPASLTQIEKQKKLEIVNDLSADTKKIKPPMFSSCESEEDIEAWLIEMEKYFEIRIFLETSRQFGEYTIF